MSTGSTSPVRRESMLPAVVRAFEAAGWQTDLSHHQNASEPDALLIEPDDRIRYVVRLKSLRANRRELLRSQLAAAAVEARVHADAVPGAHPLAVVETPQISRSLVEELKRYAEHYLPGVAIGWVDHRGGLILSGAHLEGVRLPSREGLRRSAVRSAKSGPFPLFSDLNQWQLKVLLADRIGHNYIEAPYERPRNARHLARIADVSIPTASRLVAHLRSRSVLDNDAEDLKLVQVPKLLQLWRRHLSLQVDEAPLRWIFPGKGTSTERLQIALRAFSRAGPSRSAQDGPRACLGLYSACDALGLSHVRGMPPHIYLESIEEPVLRKLGLQPIGWGERADVIARRPSAPEALFRASVEKEGVLVTDALQCWLDVSEHPSRGTEQSRILEDRVLKRLLAES